MAKYAVLLTEQQMQVIERAIRFAISAGLIHDDEEPIERARELEEIDTALTIARSV